MTSIQGIHSPSPPSDGRTEKISKAAQELEATFLSEMLKSAGMNEKRDQFGGGVGESQFSSFLIEAHAAAMVDAGGIGLTEVFIKSLMEKENDRA